MEAAVFLPYFVLVSKALDPNNDSDFIQIINQLRASTVGLAGPEEARALASALQKLDVDWKTMTPAARARIVQGAKGTLNPVARVLPKVEAQLAQSAKTLGKATKASANKIHDLGIAPSLTKTDDKVLSRIASSQSHFIRDEYGKRADKMGELARSIVEAGVKRGDGRVAIGKELKAQLTEAGVNRSQNYWQLIAATFANRARIYANLSSYTEAGISYFRFQAILDERTSAVCRFMHGRRFPVASALKAYAATDDLEDPGDIADTQPWLSSGKDDAGNGVLYLRDSGGSRQSVAHIEESGEGNVDDTGKFKQIMSDKQLEAAGVMTPPLHGHCRSTIVPDTTERSTGTKPKPLRPQPAPRAAPAPKPGAPPPDADPAAPGVVLANMRDALQRLDNAPGGVAGTDEKTDARAAVRNNLREFLSKQYGAPSVDAQENASSKYAGAFQLSVVSDKAMAHAYGYHSWDGTIGVQRSVYEKMTKAIADLSAGKEPSFENLKGLHTLVHEETHGFSKAAPNAYSGNVGVGMEEAKTEILARKSIRDMFTAQTGKDPPGFYLPKISIVNGAAMVVQDSFRNGSYPAFIGQLLRAVTDAGVPPERVGTVTENALLKVNQAKVKASTGNEHVERFVDVLIDNGEIDAHAGLVLMRRLKDPKQGFNSKGQP